MIATCGTCKIPAEVLYAAGSCDKENTEEGCPVFSRMSRLRRKELIKAYRQEIWYPDDIEALETELDGIYRPIKRS